MQTEKVANNLVKKKNASLFPNGFYLYKLELTWIYHYDTFVCTSVVKIKNMTF